ncbi:MAG: DUF3458 domain-containing protein, partial [bacterium]
AVLRSGQFPEDAGPMAHPIRPDSYIEINNFYTATVYEKGAEVVGMIRTLLGRERFRKGTDLYFDCHDGQAVTTEDFVKSMEDANDVELVQFRRWYSQAGTPELSINGAYSKNDKTFALQVTQTCMPTPGQKKKEPFHMPLAVALIGPDGKDMKFDSTGLDLAHLVEDGEFTAVLNLTESEQTFVFNAVENEPIPSILRGFSAPVKLKYQYSRDELLFLMSHDCDGFNRWEAGQRLAVDVIQEVVAQIQSSSSSEIETLAVDKRLIQAVENILTQSMEDNGVDKAMIASMLLLPSETYLAELTEVADVDAIHQAREAVRHAIAENLSGLLLSVYKLNQSSAPYAPVADDIAQRALKNVTLSYLMQPNDTEMVNLCVAQFESSDNMTDTSAAIRALVNSSSSAAVAAKEKALTEFYNRWSNEALVIDQWFNIQASSPLPNTLERVKVLMQHEAFTMKNPNRMRSLVVAFGFINTVNFHNKDGSGYEFLADCVIELNALNPQMAARVLSPLTRWRKYDDERQKLMKRQLDRILAIEDLSPDVFEIASKSV